MTLTPGPRPPTSVPDPTDPRSRRPLGRRLAELALPTVAVATAVIAPLLVADRLPDPLASHWSAAGGPDGSMPLLVDLVVLAASTALIAGGPLLAARLPMPRVQARLLVAAAGFGSGLLALVRLASLRANLDARSWEAAGDLGAGVIVVAVLVGLAAGAVGWVAAGDRPDLRPTTSPATAMRVAPGEAVVWTGGASGSVGVWVPVALLVVAALGAVALPVEVRPILITVLIVVALVVAAFGQARVTVGPRGITVALGLLRWPRLRVPIEQIADVVVEDVTPMSYGGWGLRVVPGATAVIVRRGAGLRIERRDDRTFVVTVDDAATAAGVLQAHLEATRTRT